MSDMKHRLTREQRERDYNYLWEVLHSSFPQRAAMERLGYDWDKIEAECRDAVVNAEDDLEFCRAMNAVFERFEHFCHSNLFNAYMFKDFGQDFHDFANGMSESIDPAGFKAWLDVFDNKKSAEFYSVFDDTPGREFNWKENPSAPPAEKVSRPPVKPASAVMLPGRVAYIKVPTIRMNRIAEERPMLFAFYEKYGSCSDLILDFRGNGGGATDYWGKLLVSPIITEKLVYETYMLYSRNEYNKEFIDCGLLGPSGEFALGGEYHPVSELPDFPNFHEEYLGQATHFFKSREVYRPDTEHHFTVENKIYLLTDKKVYSSSEGFAHFCKSLKWAVIVGGQTGGDGVGITPFHAILPESGLVIRYAGVMGLNPDGSSNAEYKTIPDIVCDPEEALERCLEIIAAEREK